MNCCALSCIWALNCSLAQKQTNLLSKRALSVACTNWACMTDVKAMCSRMFLEFVTSFQTVELFHLCWHNIFQLFFFQLHFKKNPNSSVGVCVPLDNQASCWPALVDAWCFLIGHLSTVASCWNLIHLNSLQPFQLKTISTKINSLGIKLRNARMFGVVIVSAFTHMDLFCSTTTPLTQKRKSINSQQLCHPKKTPTFGQLQCHQCKVQGKHVQHLHCVYSWLAMPLAKTPGQMQLKLSVSCASS